MAERLVSSPKELEAALNDLISDILELKAETAVLNVLTPYLLGSLVRRAENPENYFNAIRTSSRENLAEGITFEGGDADANQEVSEKALERHDQIFEEIHRALGFRSETAH